MGMGRMSFAALLGAALLAAPQFGAALECSVGVAPPPTEPDSPRHHPLGRSLPDSPGFNQPDACGEGIWFYDQDRDGVAGPSEPRLFGPQKTIVCASCHGEQPPADSPAARTVFLRQDASRLCLVCHDI